MNNLNIGIIGGCMTCQTDLKLSQLFFRVLSQKLQDQDNIKCFVSLKYYNEYFRIPERAKNLLIKDKPDIIILQVRPAPFIMRSELLIQDYQGRFILNPLIRSYKNLEMIETILGTKDPVILQEERLEGAFNKMVVLPVLKNNISLGQLFHLRSKALKSLSKIIIDLSEFCKEHQIKFFILGTINSYNKMHNKNLARMNGIIKNLAEAQGISYSDLFSLFGKDKDLYFGPDKFHLNETGHEIAASLLYEGIKKTFDTQSLRLTNE